MKISKQSSIIVIIYLFLTAISLITKNAHYDENYSHFTTMVSFYESDIYSAIVSSDYQSASTPLPYIILGVIHKAIGVEPSITSVRFANIIVSILTILIFYLLIKDKSTYTFAPLIIVFFYPYFLKPSFLFFMAIYGLLFFLLFLYFASKDDFRSYFLSGLSLTLAILSQQFYLIIVPFCVLFVIYRLRKTEPLKNILTKLLLLLFPLSSILPLFLIWGGLTHPNFSRWGVEFRFEYLTAVIIVIGGTLFPFTLFYLKKLNVKLLAAFIPVSAFLVVFAYPLWVNQPTAGGISGYTFHSIDIIGRVSPVLSFAAKFILAYMGLSSVAALYKFRPSNASLVLLLFAVLTIGFTLNKLPSERHMLPLIAVEYLLAFQIIRDKILYKIWVPLQVALGGIYFYYIMFVYQVQ